ncbi:DUF3313 family protein [Phenylobacterium sp.]|jgi:hypothetical protein|uniref:DUF3313 family protein n=1 Tax=Phenylobacterium sp. TaxID=1871053 RepID=UPI002E321FFE|nr:DUF3313 family protein [Phenylobacterium sp.]HEX4709495.1 DUF3313 family protein [Phenylobacterium sp.]
MPRAPMVTFAFLAGLALSVPTSLHAATPPPTWDDLVQVKSKRADAVYLLPGADFKPYTKIMLDPTEVAFRKNWLRDYNNSRTSLGSRISDSEAQEMMKKVQTGFEEIFIKAYQDAGYQVVKSPGPDVLRLRTAIVNLDVAAPDRMTAGRSRTYSREAGQATLVLEARDSVTGAVLGRAVDAQSTGDTGALIRNRVTNTADFQRLFKSWATGSIKGLNALKEQTPPPK